MERLEQVKSQFNTNLVKAFKSVEPFDAVHVNIALSISKEGLPARFLAGVIPGFTLAHAVQEEFGLPVSIRFFVPINIAVACNAGNEEDEFRAIGNTVICQSTGIVKEFQQTHFPLIPWRLSLDQPWNKEAEILLTSIWNRSLELNEEQLNQIRESVLQKGKTNAHLYVPHHLFGWQDCFSPSIFSEEDKSKENELVINCMSQSESFFQSFRKRLAWDLQVTRPELMFPRVPIDVMTQRCPGPHYLRSRDEERIEPSLGDLFSDGFTNTVRSLGILINGNPRFETAKKDLLSIFDFFHQKWILNSNLPTLDEFIKGVSV